MYIGLILQVFQIILEEKDWLNRIASWSKTSLFKSLIILVKMLVGLSLLSRFMEEISWDVWNVVTAMELFIRISFRLKTHLQLITKQLKGSFIFTIILKNIVYLH